MTDYAAISGYMGSPYQKTVDGIESQLASNNVGHYLFVNLIMPKFLEAPAPRVVRGVSVGHFSGSVWFDDYNFEHGKSYDKWLAYGQSKTAVILDGVKLAERYKGRLVVFSAHPGGAATNSGASMTAEDFEKFSDYFNPIMIVRQIDWMRSIGQGTATHFVAGFDPSIADAQEWLAAPHATDKEAARKLWELSEKHVGQKFDV
ncbi:hypothetical protein B0H19DRAFT_1256994 [Mycena capillaripes]|nr:hypothetical protein B0H19DRAFT_1256994 [Mycena capillaripes]